MNQLAASPHVRNFRNGVVAKTASLVGSTPNRNLITVGGNAMRLFIWSDLPAVYCTLDAAFKVRGPEGERLVGWKEFYRKQPIMHLNRAEFLEEVIIPNAPSRSGASFEKFSETANTFALLTASASVSLDNKGKCVSARLGFGGLQLLPAVSPEVEKMLVGESPTRELIAAAAGTAVEKINMVKDFRVSAGYKRELAVAVGQQVLTHAFKRAQGENED
jgi:carbon-monoxide dehydrogenase medium subunit